MYKIKENNKLIKNKMKNFSKKTIVLIIGIFLTGISYTFGQSISNNPTNRNITLDKITRPLYEHGYNKDNLAIPDSPRENVDTVMVTSVMNYFVMPHNYYNMAYFSQNDYKATQLTSSRFDWTSYASGRATIAPWSITSTFNPTGTSPWVKVTWNTTGLDTLYIKEVPQVSAALTCDGGVTKIPVAVIPKPTIGFSQVGSPLGYIASECYDGANVLTASYSFPLNITTLSTQVDIDYTVEKFDLISGSSAGTPSSVTDVRLTLVSTATPNVYTAMLNISFNDFGVYEVTIDKITDRIARKCEIEGDINTGVNDVFTFNVLPSPQSGKVYHVPNNF